MTRAAKQSTGEVTSVLRQAFTRVIARISILLPAGLDRVTARHEKD